MDLPILLLSFAFTGVFSLPMSCTPQTYVCDGEEVVCNCTAACNEIIHWWDNNTATFCGDTKFCGSNDLIQPGILRVEVIDCPNSSACSGTFTSRLSYNASHSSRTNIQIGCSLAVNSDTCSSQREDSVILPLINCTGLNLTSTPTVQPPTDLNPTPTSTPTAQPPTTGLNPTPTSTPTVQSPTTVAGGVVGGFGGAVVIGLIITVTAVVCVKYWKKEGNTGSTQGTTEGKTGSTQDTTEGKTGSTESTTEGKTGSAESTTEEKTGSAEGTTEGKTGSTESTTEEKTGSAESITEEKTGSAESTIEKKSSS